MVKEQHKVNDGEGFRLYDERFEYIEYGDYITFVYTDQYGLFADDDFYATHGGIVANFVKDMMLHYLPVNNPDKVHSFFTDGQNSIDLISYANYTNYNSKHWWEHLYECYTEYGLNPPFDNIYEFMEFIIPILKDYVDTIEEIKATSIDGRVFLIGKNTAVLTFWWQESPVSPSDALKIVSSLKEKYPKLNDADFYIALARKVIPLEEFTGDFEANEEDAEQIEKQKEVHLMNSQDKHKALNPYLKDRAKRQGRKLQMSNGEEMTPAEYNSYLHQEGIRRMVKRVNEGTFDRLPIIIEKADNNKTHIMRENRLNRIVENAVRKVLREGESGGWVVDSSEADEAYDMAIRYFGKEVIDDAIIRALNSDALADCLAYIFRMYDFKEWDNRVKDDDEDYDGYVLVDQGTGAILGNYGADELNDAIQDADNEGSGRFLVVGCHGNQYDLDDVVYDSNSGANFKF